MVEYRCKRIIDTSPDILGMCCYIWNIAFLRELLPMLKAALPNCIFVAGGPELLSDDAFDRLPEADYIILGEGEIPFAKLVDMLIENKTPDNIDGVMVKGANCVDIYYHYDTRYAMMKVETAQRQDKLYREQP